MMSPTCSVKPSLRTVGVTATLALHVIPFPGPGWPNADTARAKIACVKTSFIHHLPEKDPTLVPVCFSLEYTPIRSRLRLLKWDEMDQTQEFYRIQKLPPYVFAVINEMKAKARAAQLDVVDLGMGNPDGETPRCVVEKLIEAAHNPRNHRYSVSRGIPHLRQEIVRRYKSKYDVDLDPDKEAIVTMGAKDALAHLLFATVGPGDIVVSPNPAYPIHQYGVIMSEGHAHMLPMPDASTFLNRLEELYRESPKPPKMV